MNKKARILAALVLAPWLAGCSQTNMDTPVSLVTPVMTAPDRTDGDVPSPQAMAVASRDEPAGDADAARMQRCHGELKALQKVDEKRYAARKVEFDRLMSGAAIYAGVRGAVQTQTQDAVDALYRYRADKLCADIGQDVLNGLTHTGSAGRTL